MTTAVIDAATVVDLICGFPAAIPFLPHLSAATTWAAPAHLDAEVLSALGRLKRAGQLTQESERVKKLGTLAAQRWPLPPLLPVAWALTDRIAVRDALYVALAQSLDATLITTDARLRRGAAGLVQFIDPGKQNDL